MNKNTITSFGGQVRIVIILIIGIFFSFTQAQAVTTVGANITTDGYLLLNTSAVPPVPVANGTIHYNGTKFRCYENNAWKDCIGTAGGSALSSLTDAVAAKILYNGGNAQTWNWSFTDLLDDNKTGITFGENFASTRTGTSILKVSTLSGSTAMPLLVSNIGDGYSLKVEDSSADMTPFVITNTGQVGIGTSTFDVINSEKLKVEGVFGSQNTIGAYGDLNAPLYVLAKNRNSGNKAATVFAAAADDGEFPYNYLAVGITSSSFNNPAFPIDPIFTIGEPHDGFIFNVGDFTGTQGGNLIVGTMEPGKNIKFLTGGGATSANERVRINSLGYVGIATTSPGSELDVKGTLRLSGSTSGFVGLTVPATSGSTTYTLPGTDGTDGQVLKTNGSGILSWSSPGGMWKRVGTTLSPTISGDNVTSDGLLTAANGLTLTAGALNLTATIGAISLAGLSSSSITTTGANSLVGAPVNINTTGTGAVNIGNGTGAVALTLGSDALGDIYYRDAGGDLARLGIGNTSDLLQVVGGVPTWQTVTASEVDTLQTVYSRGQTINLNSGPLTISGADAVNITPTGALTLTGGATSTWGTTSGDLNLVVNGTGSGKVRIGTGATLTTPDMLVIDSGSVAPASPVNGAMYYDTVLNSFQCYELNGWKPCGTSAATAVTLQQAYVADNTITTVAGEGDFNVIGTQAVNLTPTSASQFTSGGALTLTGGATSTWGTSAGNLNLQVAGAGTTANVQIGAGGAGSSNPDLFVLDIKSDAGDPDGGVDGAMYYNSNMNKFRCYNTFDGGWLDCLRSVTNLQVAYNSGGSIITSNSNNISYTLTSGNFTVDGIGSATLNPTGGVYLGNATSAVNLPGLSASSPVFTDASKNLTSSGTVSIAQGGTGQTNKTAAFDALAPIAAKGGLIVNNGTDYVALSLGSIDGQILIRDGLSATGIKWADNTASPDSLDFIHFDDSMELDAHTSINLSTFNLTTNGTGNYLVSNTGTVGLTPTAALTLTAGAASTWSTSAGALTIDSATALNLGTVSATSVSIGRTGVNTTVNGPLLRGSIETGLTAQADGTQLNATQITRDIAEFSTVVGDDDSAKLPTAIPGRQIIIVNSGVKRIMLFPPVGEYLNGGLNGSMQIMGVNAETGFCVAYKTGYWNCSSLLD